MGCKRMIADDFETVKTISLDVVRCPTAETAPAKTSQKHISKLQESGFLSYRVVSDFC